MKTNKSLIFLLIATFSIFMVGCDKDEDPINEFNALVEYLEGSDGGYINNMGSWIVSEDAVNLADYLVLDLRSEEVFAAMLIPITGAVNKKLGVIFVYIPTILIIFIKNNIISP